jgi:MerR family transcriptional regulator, light-induced transcriptional regulator
MGTAAPHPPLTKTDELLEALLGALHAADQPRAMTVVRRALRLGWTVDDVRLHLITPALHDVGRRWERGEIGVADEHLASSVCEWLLFFLAGRVRRPPATGRRALVGCSEGELHSLGARIVGHSLSERGWTVLYLGAATPVDAWSQIARARRPDVAVLTSTTQAVLGKVGSAVRAIKTSWPDCRTVVGGQAYWDMPDAAADAGADLLSLEIPALTRELQETP